MRIKVENNVQQVKPLPRFNAILQLEKHIGYFNS